MRRHMIRHATAGLALLSATAFLAACGGGDSNGGNGDASKGKNETVNQQVLRRPIFEDKEAKIAEMAAEGCGDGFKAWAKESLVYFTEKNGGDWEHVGVDFKNAEGPRGFKACEITISDAKIAGSKGGDLNNARITVVGVDGANNPVDKAKSTELAKSSNKGSTQFDTGHDDVSVYNGLGPATDAALDYASTHDLIRGTGMKVIAERPQHTDGLFTKEGTALSLYANLVTYGNTNGTATTADSTVVWAVVETEDKQTLSAEKKRTAGGSLARMFTNAMQTMPEESDYLIR